MATKTRKRPEPREATISGSVTDAEKEIVEEASGVRGYRSPSAYIRDVVLKDAHKAVGRRAED